MGKPYDELSKGYPVSSMDGPYRGALPQYNDHDHDRRERPGYPEFYSRHPSRRRSVSPRLADYPSGSRDRRYEYWLHDEDHN